MAEREGTNPTPISNDEFVLPLGMRSLNDADIAALRAVDHQQLYADFFNLRVYVPPDPNNFFHTGGDNVAMEYGEEDEDI